MPVTTLCLSGNSYSQWTSQREITNCACTVQSENKLFCMVGWLVGVVGRRTWPRVMACAESERTESELATESQPETLTDTETNYV